MAAKVFSSFLGSCTRREAADNGGCCARNSPVMSHAEKFNNSKREGNFSDEQNQHRDQPWDDAEDPSSTFSPAATIESETPVIDHSESPRHGSDPREELPSAWADQVRISD